MKSHFPAALRRKPNFDLALRSKKIISSICFEENFEGETAFSGRFKEKFIF